MSTSTLSHISCRSAARRTSRLRSRFAVDSGSVRSVLGDVDEDTRSRAADSIRVAFEPYAGPDGVRLAAATWIVRARRAPA